MAQWSSYVQLLVLLVPVISLCESAEYFIRPTTLTTNTSCPGQPCLTVNQYMNNTDYYNMQPNTVLTFLPGNHVLKRPIQIQNVENVTLKSTIPGMYPQLLVQYSCENELCSSTQSAIKLVNVTNAAVKDISLKVLTPNISGVIVELSTNVHLQLDIHYVPQNNTYGIAILANESSYVYMDRLRVGNFRDGIRMGNTNKTNITNSTIEYCRNSGVTMIKSDTIDISHTNFSDSQESGMYLESCSNAKLTTIYATNNQRGIYLKQSSNMSFTSIYASGNRVEGMKLLKCSNTNMTSVSVTNNSWDGIFLISCSNTHLTTIRTTDNQGHGIYLSLCNKLTLTGIYASSSRGIGVGLYKCSSISMISVSATNNQLTGVYLDLCSNTNLNTINTTYNLGDGMYLKSCNKLTLTDIYASSNRKYSGMHLHECSNINMTNVSATDNLYEGMFLRSCSNTYLTTIHTTYNQIHGMHLESCDNTNIIGMHTTHNQAIGMYLESCNNSTLTGIYASSNQQDGMYLNGCRNVTITNTSATNSQQREMGLYFSFNVNLTNISTTNNHLNGMYFQSCNTLVQTGISAINSNGMNLESCNDVIITGISGNALSCINTNMKETCNATDVSHSGILLQDINNIQMEDCVFSDFVALSTPNIATEPHSVPAVIELYNSTLILSNSNFTGNNVTPIKAIGSKIIVKGEIVFSNNRALSGAALLFASSSVLVISEISSVFFQNNHAFNYGGAIYILTDEFYNKSKSIQDVVYGPSISLVTPSTRCFLSVEGGRSQARLIFMNNTAGKGGDVVYGGLVALGYDGDWNCLHSFKNISDVSEQNGLSTISSAPSHVCLCHDGRPDCLTVADPVTRSVYPGQTITLPAVVVGQDFGTVTGSVIAQFLQTYTTCSIHLDEGQQSTFVDNGKCTDLRYTLYTSEVEHCTAILTLKTNNAEVFEPMNTDDNRKLNHSWAILNEEPNYHELASQVLSETIAVKGQMLTPYLTNNYSEIHMHTINNFLKFSSDAVCLPNIFTGACEFERSVKFVFPNEIYSYPTFINISFQSCPLGFILSKKQPFKCDCNHLLQQIPRVTCDIQHQTISRDGLVWVGTYRGNETVAASKYCPYNYCKSIQTQITLTSQEADTEYSNFSTADFQCNQQHSGVLCGGCQPGLSLALGSNRCLPCSNVYISLLLPFAMAGLLLVFFIKLLDLTISQGTMNELIFYVNVVSANKHLYYSQTSVNPMTLFIAWFNLDLGIETCFFNGLTAYSRTWLQFVFPLYIWAIAGVIIIIAKYSDRGAKILGENGVPVLATLFLLTYAKLFNTIITAMSFTTLHTTQGKKLVWSADGNLDYLGPKHIFLFCVAVAALVFLWFPYTLLLLLGQWLHRLNCRIITSTLLKLKPFLDPHFAAFKDNHRYWFGLLLLVRVSNVLISAGTSDTAEIVEFSTAILSILLTFWGQNVYRSIAVGTFGTAFLLNLAILNVTKMFSNNSDGSSSVASFTLIAIALAQFVGLILYKVFKQNQKMMARCTSVSKNEAYDEWELYEQAAIEREMESDVEVDRESKKSGSIESIPTYGI